MLAAGATRAQYKPVDKGSTIAFKIKNLGFDVNGSFSGIKGVIAFNMYNATNNSFDVTVDAATVNTDNNLRDEHLRGESYFDIKNYPTIHFVSGKITASGKPGSFVAFGKLTIKNRSQDISIPFTATPAGDDIAFKGSFKMNRKDFNVGGTSTIGNEVELSLNVLAKKDKQ